MFVDLLGYLGLLLLVVSLSRSDLKSLRKWGIASASIMTVQAVLLGISSLIVINAFVVGLHFYKLVKK